MSERRGEWIETYSGRRFHPLDPRAEEVCLTDIAHSLALQCRFTGHTREPYSVAEHSVRLSRICSPRDAFAGLLHDAAEAYLCDLARPVKRDPALACYAEWERDLLRVIGEKFRVTLAPLPRSVRDADERLLATEARDLMAYGALDRWGGLNGIVPLPGVIVPCRWDTAKAAFLSRFEELSQ